MCRLTAFSRRPNDRAMKALNCIYILFLSIADDDDDEDSIDYTKKQQTVRVTHLSGPGEIMYTVNGGYVHIYLPFRITRLSQSPPSP